jgi:Ran GTPase-activating protein (RanGAP) involved in mRNA processing and transport
MNLEAFLQVLPAELGEHVIPAARTLMLCRASRKTRDALARMRCLVDVQPGKSIRQAYSDENATLAQRRAAVRVFVGRSLQLCMTDFRLRSFVLHGMVLDQTGSLNAMLLQSRGLEVLDMYNNHIDEDGVGAVFAAIPSSLRVLRLTRQWINRAAVTPLCQLLARLSALEELDLSENYLNSGGMQAITGSIVSTRLSSVSLGFNHLKSRFWNEHPELGFDRFVLRKLDIRHNMLQAVSCDSVFACVRGSAAMLAELDVSYNDMRLVGVSYLSTALQECYGLRRLNIAGNLCGDAALALLLAALQPREPGGACAALESLDAAHNKLTCASARIFNRTVTQSAVLQKSLHSVTFSYNDMNDAGVLLILEALLPCALQKLGLGECLMGEPAGLSLAGTMLHWPALASLDVHGNRLCGTSLVLMARALSENDSPNKYMVFTGNWGTVGDHEALETILASATAGRAQKARLTASQPTRRALALA